MSTKVQPASRTSGARAPMTRMNFSLVAAIMLGVLVVGVAVGFVTNNAYFAFAMFSLPLVVFFTIGIFDDRIGLRTRPVGGSDSAALPIAALVASCVVSVIGIALGHASRHVIQKRGGEGEEISFVALIVGYSALGVQVAVALWFVTNNMHLA